MAQFEMSNQQDRTNVRSWGEEDGMEAADDLLPTATPLAGDILRAHAKREGEGVLMKKEEEAEVDGDEAVVFTDDREAWLSLYVETYCRSYADRVECIRTDLSK